MTTTHRENSTFIRCHPARLLLGRPSTIVAWRQPRESKSSAELRKSVIERAFRTRYSAGMSELSELSTLDDHQLVLLIRQRDGEWQDAAAVLSGRLSAFVAAIITSAVRVQSDDLADVMQQVWIQAFRGGSEGFASAAEFRGWLKSVARSRAIDLVRRRKPMEIPDEVDVAERTRTEDPRCDALQVCLEELSRAKPEFATVVRGITAGKSGQELSQELGIPANTVYSRFDRSKIALKECVERRLL